MCLRRPSSCDTHLKSFGHDLQVVGSQFLKEVGKPVKVAESDVDVSTTWPTLSEL